MSKPRTASRAATCTLAVLLTAGVAGGTAARAEGHLPLDVSGTPMPSLAPIVKRASPAVVNISTRGTVAEKSGRNPLFDDPFFKRFFDAPEMAPRQRQFQSAGSGVVVDAKEGFIITNAHVIENANEITVTTNDGHDYKATVVGSDVGADIALIKVKDAKLAALPIGDSAQAEVGDFVLAIGNPFGLQHTVTYGIISAVGRSGINPDGYEDFIQTDASINPGNSGGALINLHGELVGINSAILSRSGGNIGIGFAIPSNMVRSIMDQLVKYGEVKRGLLGVSILTLTPDLAENLGAKDLQGALVQQVVEGSAAEKAGLKAGDVITAVNGQTVKAGPELRNRIGMMRVGETVDITYYRDGKTHHANATVSAKGAAPGEESPAGELHRAFEGADLGDASNGGGVLIRSVEAESPAAQAGLRQNDVITAVNRQKVGSLKDLRAIVKGQQTLLLIVRRGDAVIVVPVR
ncbi:MAG: DegQ family serine endoprotease [Pseudomonadota bacterium]|jgi:serine protease Do/serine protease DegQ